MYAHTVYKYIHRYIHSYTHILIHTQVHPIHSLAVPCHALPCCAMPCHATRETNNSLTCSPTPNPSLCDGSGRASSRSREMLPCRLDVCTTVPCTRLYLSLPPPLSSAVPGGGSGCFLLCTYPVENIDRPLSAWPRRRTVGSRATDGFLEFIGNPMGTQWVACLLGHHATAPDS